MNTTPFFPVAPQTWEQVGIEPAQVEPILLRALLSAGVQSGQDLSADLCLPLVLVRDLLDQLRI